MNAARGMEIALQDDPVFVGQSYFNREKGFAHARALGVTRMRVNANWAFALTRKQQLQTSRPASVNYQFNTLDSTIDAAARHGIRVHLSVAGPAPAWAAGNRRLGNYTPNQKEFSAFAAALATHMRGRVDRYSIWNEPNWKTWLGPMRSAASQYRGLYSRGYAAIKQADPRAKVLIGETAPYAQRGRSVGPVAFMRAVACVNRKYKRVHRCTKLKADGFAHHPYYFSKSPRFKYPGADNATMGTLGNLTRGLDRIARTGQLRRNGGGKLGLYLTEFGYFSSGHRALRSRRLRGKYLADGFNLALRNGRVKSQLQYLLVQPPKRFPWSFFDLGLISTG
ncbi:MAG TPA: cellulase family glycosylhydrolase, partial [Vicinamibacteria bacterium]